jgi:4-amino-4-deoxy-L-arabinose transferase-like glycosyltransferase
VKTESRIWRHPAVLPFLVLFALLAFYLLTTLPNLSNDPIVGGDEGWIMSASEKLAREGVFGSDLFAGFYAAEERYYFNLPLHHVVLSGVFKVAGVGLAQARLVGVVFGLAALILTFLLGRRIGGVYVGLGAAALLVLLRLNLTAFTGLTLTDLGAIVRYDLVAVPYAIGAVYLLAREPESPRAGTVAAAGLLLGLASLTQFIGAFYILPVGIFLLTAAVPQRRRFLLVAVMGWLILVPFLPYFLFIFQDLDGFRGQARAVEQETHFRSPSFYLRNLRNEPERYALSTGLEGLPQSLRDAARRPSARLTVYIVAPLAFALASYRAIKGSPRHRLLALLIVAIALQLALFESTKRFVYWVAVVPFLCVAIADLGRWALEWRPGRREARWAAATVVVVVGFIFAVEGLAVGVKDIAQAGDAPEYAAVGQRLNEVVPASARVIGDNRLWLTMRDTEYRSLLLLFYFTNPRISREQATDVEGAMRRIDADFLLLSPLTREILEKLTAADSAAFQRYLSERARLVATVEADAYGPIEVYELRR